MALRGAFYGALFSLPVWAAGGVIVWLFFR